MENADCSLVNCLVANLQRRQCEDGIKGNKKMAWNAILASGQQFVQLDAKVLEG